MSDPVTSTPAPAPATPPTPPSATPPASAPVAPSATPPAAATSPATPPAAPAAGAPPPGTPASTPAPSAEVAYSLSLPAENVLEPTAVERATALAQAAKLAPDAAQKVVEFANAEAAAVIEKQKAEYTAKVATWENEVKADPELGGPNLTRTTMRSKTVLDRFGDPELVEALNKTGFGNYRPLVRFMNKIGAAMESDAVVRPGGGAGGGEKSLAERLYPELPRTATT